MPFSVNWAIVMIQFSHVKLNQVSDGERKSEKSISVWVKNIVTPSKNNNNNNNRDERRENFYIAL